MNISDNEKMFHLNCTRKDIGRYVLLPGDPGRCEKIASYFENPVHIGTNREFNIFTGTLCNEKVSVCSTGIGGPSAAIAMEELIMSGADTFIRIGTCGGIALQVESGDLCIAMSAVRQSGITDEYAPAEYPATANFELVEALAQASKKLNVRYHVGVVQSKDSFYGQHSPERMPVASMLKQKWEAYKMLGVLASEMECAAVFTVAAARGVRAGSVFHTIWNQERVNAGLPMKKNHSNETSIQVGIEAIKIIIEKDHNAVL